MKVMGKVGIVLGVLAVLLGVAAAVLYGLATTDDNAGKYEAEPSMDILEPAALAAVTGKETEFTQDQINGFLAHYIRENGVSLGGKEIKKLYLQLGETAGDVGVYLVCPGLGKELGITARGTLTYMDAAGELSFQIGQLKVGRLKLPVDWVLSWVSSKLPQDIEVQGDTLFIGSSALRFTVADLETPLTLEGLRVEQGKAYGKVSGTLEVLQEYLVNKLGESPLGDLLSAFGIDLP